MLLIFLVWFISGVPGLLVQRFLLFPGQASANSGSLRLILKTILPFLPDFCNKTILSNEKYTGNIILYKTVMLNYPYSARMSNDGGPYRQQYCMTNGVDAIIDEDTFKAVQEEKKRRSSYENGPDGKKRKARKYSSKRPDEQLSVLPE